MLAELNTNGVPQRAIAKGVGQRLDRVHTVADVCGPSSSGFNSFCNG